MANTNNGNFLIYNLDMENLTNPNENENNYNKRISSQEKPSNSNAINTKMENMEIILDKKYGGNNNNNGNLNRNSLGGNSRNSLRKNDERDFDLNKQGITNDMNNKNIGTMHKLLGQKKEENKNNNKEMTTFEKEKNERDLIYKKMSNHNPKEQKSFLDSISFKFLISFSCCNTSILCS